MISPVLHSNQFWNSQGRSFLHGAKTPILVDSFPGQSGNFIAYAVNLCVFGLNPGKNIFTDIGTINTWKFDEDYISNMQCFSAHWSDLDLEIPLPDKCTVIRVITDSHIGQLISIINLILRAGDRPYESVGNLSDNELIRSMWHKFVNFSAPKWKHHDKPPQYLDFAMLWNKNKFQHWMLGIARYHGQGTNLRNLEVFEEMYDLYWQQNHGMIIWKESGSLLQQHLHDHQLRHFSTPFHDFAVFYRIISFMQLIMPPDEISDLITDCMDGGLDFQIARQQYCTHIVR